MRGPSAHHGGEAAGGLTLFPMQDQENLLQVQDQENLLKDFGKRIQRCYGCFIAYHLKDMYLGEDVTFFCASTSRKTQRAYQPRSNLLSRL